MKSRTKKYRARRNILTALSLALNLGPVAGYAIAGVAQSDLVREKLVLSLTVFVVLILSIVSAVNRIAMRSRIWIVLIGIYVCLGEILIPLLVIGGSQILDETLVTPLRRHYSTKTTISAEIDRRL
jgi:hypothetical protein